MMKQKIKKGIFISLTGLVLLLQLGCYRMPNHDEYSVVPTTNNPDVIGKTNANWMPNAGF